jgi:hypothetical protein
MLQQPLEPMAGTVGKASVLKRRLFLRWSGHPMCDTIGLLYREVIMPYHAWGVNPSYLWGDGSSYWNYCCILCVEWFTHPTCQKCNEPHPNKYLRCVIWHHHKCATLSRCEWLHKPEGHSAPDTLIPTHDAQYAFRKQEPLLFMLPCTAGGPHSKGNLKTKIAVHKVDKTTNKKVCECWQL